MTKNATTIPVHLGLILDGNRRWAAANGMTSLQGHDQGYQNFKDITKYAVNRGIKYVSAFVFSTENWNRTKREVKYLMDLSLSVLTKGVDELDEQGIKVVCLGSLERLSKKLVKAIANAEESTKNNTRGTLCICFNYGGHQEVTDAVKAIVKGGFSEDEVTNELVSDHLYHPEVPPVDLLIRTSGEHRLSGFMLYRIAYSELYFTNVHWPDFDKSELDKALDEYSNRDRRFGK